MNKFSSLSYIDPDCDPNWVPVWDPVDSVDDTWHTGGDLDLEVLQTLGRTSKQIVEDYLPGAVYTGPSAMDGREVGDDRLDVCRNPYLLSTVLAVQETVVGMRTSWPDTFISNVFWNFCEVSNRLPTAVEQSFDFCRKSNGFKNLGFADSPPLRILLDVMKGDRSHSSTVPGKASMLGSRMSTPRDELLPDLYLASYLQDGYLRTSRSTEPKYLPKIMGGSGARPLYGSAENLYLSVQAYRGGGYDRIYGSATRELQRCLERLEAGEASMPILCMKLRDKHEYLHGTYDAKIFIPLQSWKDKEKESLPEPFIKASGGANWFSSFENRLVRTKHLVTRTSAVREWEYSTAIREQLLGFLEVTKLEAERKRRSLGLRQRFESALHANSAFSNLLARKATPKDVSVLMNDKRFTSVNIGSTHFSRWDAEWIVSGGKSEHFSIEDLTVSEDLYLREEVSEEETFKVGGIPLQPIYSRKPLKPISTSIKVGLYEINQSMLEWSDDLIQRLKDIRKPGVPLEPYEAQSEFIKNPEWVNDDTSIIGKCLHDTATLHMRSARVGLVSSDRRLANQLSQTCNVLVERIPPLAYILWATERGLDLNQAEIDPELLNPFIEERGRGDPLRKVYLDTGSISAAAMKLHQEIEGPSEEVFERTLIDTGYSAENKRYERYILRKIPENARKLKSSPIRPVLRPKRYSHKSASSSSPYYRPRRGSVYGSSSYRSIRATSWRSVSEAG